MIIEPRVRGFICTTAHPIGCERNVMQQIERTRVMPEHKGPSRALIVGCSTGYGLSSRIALAFGMGCDTIGVALERQAAGSRTATAGWYNTAAFERFAHQNSLYAKSVIGDAFSKEVKEKTIELIKRDLGQVDLVVYSLAAPRRTTHEGQTFSSVLKPVGSDFTSKTIDLSTNRITEVSVSAANAEEIEGTIKVMGGEDWRLWIEALREAGVLANHAITVAYSYIGPSVTHAVYRDGTVGLAKKDLEKTANDLSAYLGPIGGKAFVSVNKALVTQSSSAIPVVPLYIAILYKIMKEKGLHEGCIEQMCRLYNQKVYANGPQTDEQGLIRMDDWELGDDVQAEVMTAWEKIDDDNVAKLADIEGYWDDFYRLFGFGVEGVDYESDVDATVPIPSLEEDPA